MNKIHRFGFQVRICLFFGLIMMPSLGFTQVKKTLPPDMINEEIDEKKGHGDCQSVGGQDCGMGKSNATGERKDSAPDRDSNSTNLESQPGVKKNQAQPPVGAGSADSSSNSPAGSSSNAKTKN